MALTTPSAGASQDTWTADDDARLANLDWQHLTGDDFYILAKYAKTHSAGGSPSGSTQPGGPMAPMQPASGVQGMSTTPASQTFMQQMQPGNSSAGGNQPTDASAGASTGGTGSTTVDSSGNILDAAGNIIGQARDAAGNLIDGAGRIISNVTGAGANTGGNSTGNAGTADASTQSTSQTSTSSSQTDLSTSNLNSPEAVLTALVQKHGDVLGKAYAINPTNTDGTPNQNPILRYSFSDGSHVDMTSQGQISGQVLKATPKSGTVPDKPVAVRQNAAGQLVSIGADGSETIVDPTTKPASASQQPKAVIRTVGGNLVSMAPDGTNAQVIYQGNTDAAKQEVATITSHGRVDVAQINGDSRVKVAQDNNGARIVIADDSNQTKLAIDNNNNTTKLAQQDQRDVTQVSVAQIRAGATTGAATIRGQSLVDVTALKSTLGPNSPYLASAVEDKDANGNLTGTFTVTFERNPDYAPPEIGQATNQDPYIQFRGPDGTVTQVENKNYQPKMLSTPTKDDPNMTFFDARTGQVISKPNPDYVNAVSQGLTNIDQAVNKVQQEIADGTMSTDQGNQLISQLRQQQQFTALGMTPDQYYTQQQQQANGALNVLNNYSSMLGKGGDLANNFLSAAAKIRGKVPEVDANSIYAQMAQNTYGGAVGAAQKILGGLTPISDRMSILQNMSTLGQAKAALNGDPNAIANAGASPGGGLPTSAPGQPGQTNVQGPSQAFLAAAQANPGGQTPAWWAANGGQPQPNQPFVMPQNMQTWQDMGNS